MVIADIRRTRLKAWFSGKQLPEKEKSYLSQLMGGKASFGEKAARRLERDYAMGNGYLDCPIDDGAAEAPGNTTGTPAENVVGFDRIALDNKRRKSPDIARVITLLSGFDERGIARVLGYIEGIEHQHKTDKTKQRK